MFSIKVFRVDVIKFNDGSETYRLWFLLETGLCWIYSKKKFAPGEECTLDLYPMNTQDTKTNFKIGIRVK